MEKSTEVVWITGASSGIGKELALQYANKGFIVALAARRLDLMESIVQTITQKGGKAMAFYCDVLNESSIKSCVDEIISNFGRLDISIANAGYGVSGGITQLSAADWERQLAGNVIGLALTAKHAIPHLQKTQGRLVLMGSVAAFVPNPFIGAYGASKAAVHNIGESLQLELKGTGVSCTTVHPGFVESEITRVDNSGAYHPEKKDPRPKNLMWPTDKAAKVIIKAIEHRKSVFVFTGHGKFAVFLGRFFPSIARIAVGKTMFKPE